MVNREIERRPFRALQRPGRSGLGMPGTIDTFKAMLAEARFALVLAPREAPSC